MSVPITGFVWVVLFRIDYFTPFNVIALFILLGVGADDLYVFWDGWCQARQMLSKDLFPETYRQRRLQLAFDRT